MDSSAQIAAILDEIVETRQRRAKSVTEVLDRINAVVSDLTQLQSECHQQERAVPQSVRKKLERAASESEDLLSQFYDLRDRCERLIARWTKETVTIGVAGKARQGKSQLLQAMTGLDNSVLPASHHLPTTGARSKIKAGEGEASAIVHFLDETEFLERIVGEYFTAIGLEARPHVWAEFDQPLPPLPPEPKQSQRAQYELLEKMHVRRNEFRPLLGRSPQPIKPAEIVEYVSQRQDDGSERTNYLAVKQVDISTEFPNLKSAKLSVIDLPGLGEIARGHAAKLTETLEREADVVLYVKLPPDTGDKWGEDDIDVFECVNEAIPELELSQYLYVLLNEREDGGNSQLVQMLMDSPPPAVTSCQIQRVVAVNHDQVREEVFVPLLDSLTERLPQFDDSLAQGTAEKLEKRLQRVETLMSDLADISRSLDDGGAIRYNPLRSSFLKELRNQLEELLEAYYPETHQEEKSPKAAQLQEDINHDIEQSLEAIRSAPPNYDEQTLKLKKNDKGGWPGAVQEELHSMRSALTLDLANKLEEGINAIVDGVRREVVECVMNGKLQSLSAGKVPDAAEALELLITAANQSGSKRIQKGLEFVRDMGVSYHSQIHPSVRQQLSALDPLSNFCELREIAPGDEPMRPPEVVKKALENQWPEICYRLQAPLRKTCQEIAWGVFTAIEECRDRLVRSEEIETEWDYLLYPRRHDIWPTEYQTIRNEMEASNRVSVATDKLRGSVQDLRKKSQSLWL